MKLEPIPASSKGVLRVGIVGRRCRRVSGVLGDDPAASGCVEKWTEWMAGGGGVLFRFPLVAGVFSEFHSLQVFSVLEGELIPARAASSLCCPSKRKDIFSLQNVQIRQATKDGIWA